MKRGFTLIELLGVIIILGLLSILVFPSIINSVRNSSKKTDEVTLQLIYNAADLYIKEYKNNFPRINGAKYIVDLEDLIGGGHLVSPIKLSESDDDITKGDKKCVQVSYDNGFNYEFKNYSECVILIDDVNVDINGDRKLTDEDPILLSKYLISINSGVKIDETDIKGATDINKDDVVNEEDVNELSEVLGLVKTIPGIFGDANGDGLITLDDYETVCSYVAHNNPYIILDNANVDGEETITIMDRTIFERLFKINISE